MRYGSGKFLATASRQAKKPAACQDQTRQSCTHDRTRNSGSKTGSASSGGLGHIKCRKESAGIRRKVLTRGGCNGERELAGWGHSAGDTLVSRLPSWGSGNGAVNPKLEASEAIHISNSARLGNGSRGARARSSVCQVEVNGRG